MSSNDCVKQAALVDVSFPRLTSVNIDAVCGFSSIVISFPNHSVDGTKLSGTIKLYVDNT